MLFFSLVASNIVSSIESILEVIQASNTDINYNPALQVNL